MITTGSYYRNRLALIFFSAGLLFSSQITAMEFSERTPQQILTPEQRLNEAAVHWIRERNLLAKYAKQRHCSQKTCGASCTAVGVGLLSLSAVEFYDAKYNSHPSVAFIPAVIGTGLALAGTLSTAIGLKLSRAKMYYALKDIQKLDLQYIAGTYRVLTIKPSIDETQLTPAAQELLALTRQNPFYDCNE